MNGSAQHYIRKISLSDVLDLREIARGVNMEVTQLDAGSFESDVVQLKVHNVLASRITSNQRLRLQGDLKFLTFSCLSGGESSPKWHGVTVEPNEILAADAGESFDLIVPPGVEAYCVSVIGDAEVTLRHLGGPVLARKLTGADLPIPCDPDAIQELKDWFMEQYREVKPYAGMKSGSALVLKQAFIRRLAACLRSGRVVSSSKNPTISARVKIARRVEQYLLNDLAIPQTVEELCAYAGTSRRTLEYAFRDYFGTSPNHFVKALRLNAARQDLMLAEYGNVQVKEVASGWGFTHMGQFSHDYCHMFGENPIDTLRNSDS